MAEEREPTQPESEPEKVEDLDVSEEESEDVKGGNVSIHDFTISHTVDKSSPSL